MIKIFEAKKIITMDPSLPEATHIAVKEGKVLGVGSLENLQSLGQYELDTQFADKYIYPGFVEGHSHALEGAMWNYLYLGFYPRHDPDGNLHSGYTNITEIQQRLRSFAEDKPSYEPIIAWGFDPVYFNEQRLDRYIIDEAVKDRPVVILHANLHLMTVNSAMLALTTLNNDTEIEGVMRNEDGKLNGELREMAAMFAVYEALGRNLFEEVDSHDTLIKYGEAAKRVGITTITDLYNPLTKKGIKTLNDVCSREDYPIRLVPAMAALNWENTKGIQRVTECKELNTDKLHFGLIKIMTDGSIQGFSARMLWPGYHNGSENGICNAPPETLKQMVLDYHQSGLQLHIHTNGDEAVEIMLDAIEQAQTLWYRADHRHTLQHCQFISQAQMRRAAKLGVCLNMFVNHIYYWGDIHHTKTLGYSRSRRMQPLKSALSLNIPVAMHSDAPITPLGPLFSMWCAIERKTSTDHILGDHERLTVEQALHTITLGAAYTLNMDDVIGSLEVGKYADMAILDIDLYEIKPEQLKELKVHATVLGGQVHVNS